jgi:hypothetical protein
MHHPPEADTEDTEDIETKRISEILCAHCDFVVNKFHFLVSLRENRAGKWLFLLPCVVSFGEYEFVFHALD